MIYEKFTPDGVLKLLHNSMRFTGGNTFDASLVDGFTDDQMNYVTGVFSIPIIFTCIYFIWFVVIMYCWFFCSGNKTLHFNNDTISMTLMISGYVIVLVLMIVSIVANVQSLSSMNSMLKDIKELDVFFDTVNATLNQIIDMEPVLETLNVAANTACTGLITYPFGTITTSIHQLKMDVHSVSKEIGDVDSETKEIRDMVVQFQEIWGGLFMGLTISFLILFTLYVSIYIYRLVYDNSNYYFSIGHKIIWYFLFDLTFILFIVSILAAAMGTIGSDFCVPTPDKSVEMMMNIWSESGESCTEKPFSYMCHYFECDDDYHSINQDLNVGYTTVSQVKQLITQGQTDAGSGNQCRTDLDMLHGTMSGVGGGIATLMTYLQCNAVRPMYVKFFYNDMCNSAMSNFGIVWVCMVTSLIVTMVMMFFYPFTIFRKQQQNYLLLVKN